MKNDKVSLSGLRKGFYSTLNLLWEMVKKSLGLQVAIYGIFVTILILLINLNSPFQILGVDFKVPTAYLVTFIFVLAVPLVVLICFEIFSKEEYDENTYYKIAKGCWHIFFLGIGIIFFGIIAMLLWSYLQKVSSYYLSLTLTFVIVTIILASIKSFFNKRGVNIYNPFTWVKD